VQVVTNTEQVILAADITQAANDSSQLGPMIARAIDELAHVSVDQPIGTVLADGGYWNSPQITEIRERGIDVLVPIKARKRTAPRTLGPRRGPEAERIDKILDTPGRSSALPTTTADRRAGLREHQVPAAHRSLPAPRHQRLQGRMEADRRNPQPPQALARDKTHPRGLTKRDGRADTHATTRCQRYRNDKPASQLGLRNSLLSGTSTACRRRLRRPADSRDPVGVAGFEPANLRDPNAAL
jgi:Transposase DDE domain